MQVAWSDIDTLAHKGSKTCRRMKVHWTQHAVSAASVQVMERRFTVYGADELRNVMRFKYLGRVLLHKNNTIPAMRRNLKRAQATLG